MGCMLLGYDLSWAILTVPDLMEEDLFILSI